MRPFWLLLPAVALFSNLAGCSMFIEQCGVDLSEVTTQGEMRKKFGAPTKSSESNGEVSETYVSRWRIAKSNGYMQGYVMIEGVTFGLAEFVFFPLELSRTGQRLLFGQELQVTYDPSGTIKSINVGDIDTIHPDRKTNHADDKSSARLQNVENLLQNVENLLRD